MSSLNDFGKKIREKGLSHIITKTIPWYFRTYLDRMITSVVRKIYINKPLEDIIIIESHNDFDSNGGAFYDFLINNRLNEKYKIVWFLRNKCPKNLPKNVEGYRYNRPSFKRVYYHCIAKYIVCEHFIIPSIRDGQVSYYTTHGGFSLKSIKGNIVLPDEINYILNPSKDLESLMAKEYDLKFPNERMISIGMPEHDIINSNKSGDLKKISKKKFDKMFIWMPTFRKSVDGRVDSSNKNPLGIPIINDSNKYIKLNEELSKRSILLIIKLHPMQDLSTVKINTLSNIIILNANDVKKLGVDNYRLMRDADAMISDYSSVAYDFLQLDRPIAYTIDDVNEYSVGLKVKNPKDYMAGHIIHDFNDFYSFILDVAAGKDEFKMKRSELFPIIWDFHDDKNCLRLAKHMGIY